MTKYDNVDILIFSPKLVLGAPFLLSNPIAYLKGAFNLGRVFLFEWTVNWRFLSEEVFVHPAFHITLLVLHLAVLAVFAQPWFRCLKAFAKLLPTGVNIVSQLFLLPMFSANLIGIAFSRSLHYQFYVWYFHTLPYLLWATPYSTWVRYVSDSDSVILSSKIYVSLVARLCILGVIEMSWNTFPSTTFSSAALHLCHGAILLGLFRARHPNKDLDFPISKTKSQ